MMTALSPRDGTKNVLCLMEGFVSIQSKISQTSITQIGALYLRKHGGWHTKNDEHAPRECLQKELGKQQHKNEEDNVKSKHTDAEQQTIDEIYTEGLARLSRRSLTMLDDALFFKSQSEKSDGHLRMKVLSEIFERSAKNIAKAAARHPDYFPESFAQIDPAELPTPDTLLCLTIIAGLSEPKDAKLFAEWEQNHYPAWKVMEIVQSMKHRKPRHSKEIRVIEHATIERKNHNKLILTSHKDGKDLTDLGGEVEARFYKLEKEQ